MASYSHVGKPQQWDTDVGGDAWESYFEDFLVIRHKPINVKRAPNIKSSYSYTKKLF